MIKTLIAFFIFWCLLASVSGVMPHWRLWEYRVAVNANPESCAVSVTPYLLGYIKINSDKVSFTEKALQISINQQGDIDKTEYKCGGKFSFYNDKMNSKKKNFAFYRNPEFFSRKSLPGFLILTKEIYLTCLRGSISFIHIEQSQNLIFECRALKVSTRDFGYLY